MRLTLEGGLGGSVGGSDLAGEKMATPLGPGLGTGDPHNVFSGCPSPTVASFGAKDARSILLIFPCHLHSARRGGSTSPAQSRAHTHSAQLLWGERHPRSLPPSSRLPTIRGNPMCY